MPRAPERPNDDALSIDALLAEAGFTSAGARTRARTEIERAGLTRAGKQGIAAYKREAALALLRERLAVVCGSECGSLISDGREPVVAAGSACEVCEGSNNRRAALAAMRAMRARRVSRVLIVGGTQRQQRDLGELLALPPLSVEFVDGTRSHTQKEAIANMKRAQLVVIWGSTPLRHAVSDLYTREPLPHLRVISVSKRGIEAVCREIERNMHGGRR